ncbi:MAG: galactose-1-phosphate uridylyltransferase [Armatimonadetes bacterium]|nr:galactose-1-phosphate uridylyltransferase [Armatimonadota bacterium]
MSELRWHPFLGEWVVTATHRQERTFFPPEGFCPLCPTKPGGPPTEIPCDNYEIAVFENKFPSLRTPPLPPEVGGSDLIPARPSDGVCEVVCYSPDHDATLAGLPLRQIRKLVRVWRDRYIDLIARPTVRYVYIFENKGKEIGVTLSHPHGQIYAYPFIPRAIGNRLDAERRHFERRGTRLAQDWLAEETKDGRRVVWESDAWIAVVPTFARYPYETHLAPKSHVPNLRALDDTGLDGLAEGLRVVTQKLDRLFGFSMPYIMSLFQHEADYTWLIVELNPPYRTADKLKYLAGSEAACGVFINDTLPEETAARLRAL